jgi:hypothetical protein
MDGNHFVTDVLILAAEQSTRRPIVGIAQARQMIGDESATLHSLLAGQTKEFYLPWEQARLHLLTIAATAIQAAQQLGIDSREQAIEKEIPW